MQDAEVLVAVVSGVTVRTTQRTEAHAGRQTTMKDVFAPTPLLLLLLLLQSLVTRVISPELVAPFVRHSLQI